MLRRALAGTAQTAPEEDAAQGDGQGAQKGVVLGGMKAAKPKQRFRPRKTRELMLYVLNKIGGKKGMTIPHLLNVMFRIDMEAFVKTGESITGAKWYKTADGVEF